MQFGCYHLISLESNQIQLICFDFPINLIHSNPFLSFEPQIFSNIKDLQSSPQFFFLWNVPAERGEYQTVEPRPLQPPVGLSLSWFVLVRVFMPPRPDPGMVVVFPITHQAEKSSNRIGGEGHASCSVVYLADIIHRNLKFIRTPLFCSAPQILVHFTPPRFSKLISAVWKFALHIEKAPSLFPGSRGLDAGGAAGVAPDPADPPHRRSLPVALYWPRPRRNEFEEEPLRRPLGAQPLSTIWAENRLYFVHANSMRVTYFKSFSGSWLHDCLGMFNWNGRLFSRDDLKRHCWVIELLSYHNLRGNIVWYSQYRVDCGNTPWIISTQGSLIPEV